MDDHYVEITRVGQPVSPASLQTPVVRSTQPYPMLPADSVRVQRPVAAPTPSVDLVGPISAADLPPTLSAPAPAPALPQVTYPVPANPGVPTQQSLFTNGYGGTRAYAVTLPSNPPPVHYQPVTAPLGAQPYPQSVYIGRGVVGQPKLYAPNQPIRNFFRWLTP